MLFGSYRDFLFPDVEMFWVLNLGQESRVKLCRTLRLVLQVPLYL